MMIIREEFGQNTQIQQSVAKETMNHVDTSQLINETQAFNYPKQLDENSRIILTKFIYLINQGYSFKEEEIELLFFRVTKLFQSNNSRLRQMTYKLLKMMMPSKYIHIILQSLSNDLISNNLFIKREALRFIPCIQDELYIQQIEKLIHQALCSKNYLIQSTALQVGIQIINKFPNLVGKWLYDIFQKIDQPQENLQYHTLILLHEMKKTNLPQFLKIIIVLTKQQLKDLTQLQINKFIQELLPYTQNNERQELIAYLFKQANIKNALTMNQSTRILINELEIENRELSQMNKFVEENLHPQNPGQMHNLIKIQIRQQLINKNQILYIETLAFHFQLTLSEMGILFFMKLNFNKIGMYLGKLFANSLNTRIKFNFLQGLQEIVHSHPEYVSEVLWTLYRGFWNQMDEELVEYAIKITQSILHISEEHLQQVYKILRILYQNPGLTNKSNAIKLIEQCELIIKPNTQAYYSQNQLNMRQNQTFLLLPYGRDYITRFLNNQIMLANCGLIH